MSDSQIARPEPVDGTEFPSSPRKALWIVFGGLFFVLLAAVVTAWRFEVFTLDNERPGLFLTICGLVLGVMGAGFMIAGVVSILRNRCAVIAADRFQLLQRWGETVVVVQVMYANVAGLMFVRHEGGKNVLVRLADRAAAGTYDVTGAIRTRDDGESAELVILDQFQSTLDELREVLDAAIVAWRAEQPEEPGDAPEPVKKKPWRA